MKSLTFLDSKSTDLLSSEIVITSLEDAIRECIENSIDAKASEIKCFIDPESLSFTVVDNGRGMNSNVLNQLGNSRYTSKILSLEDLPSCTTYGFRGQALQSIANISHTKIITKSIDNNKIFSSAIYLGRKINVYPKVIDYGALNVELDDYQCLKKHGSVIKVIDLFSNLQVRRNYALRTPYPKVIENIKKMLYDLLIINPFLTIRVQRKVNGAIKTVFRYDGTHKIASEELCQSRILNSMGFEISNSKFVVLKSILDDFTVEILVGAELLPSSTYQRLYFNSKRIHDDSIFRYFNKFFRNRVADESIGDSNSHYGKPITYFGNSLTGFPIITIKIKGAISLSDRLQDPSKNIYLSNNLETLKSSCKKLLESYFRNKKFENSNYISDFVTSNASNYNYEKNHSFLPIKDTGVSRISMGTNNTVQSKLNRFMSARFEKNGTKKVSQFTIYKTNTIMKNKVRFLGTSLNSSNKYEIKFSDYFSNIDKIRMTKDDIKNCKVISQVDKKFILLKTTSNNKSLLLIADQHACDERIKVEEYFQNFVDSIYFSYAYTNGDPADNSLSEVLGEKIVVTKFPISIQNEYKSNFFSWGLKYFIDDSNNIYVTEIPSVFKSKLTKDHKKNEEFIRKVILQHYYDIVEERKLKSCTPLIVAKNLTWSNWVPFLPDIIIDIINSKACRSAIKFGDPLSTKECIPLIEKLSRCKFAFQCAHGRPSIIPFVDLS